MDASTPLPPSGLDAVVLAAGAGTRMQSRRPKPLHSLCGRPMILYVIDALIAAGVRRIAVVVGPGGPQVAKTVREAGPDVGLVFAEQRSPRGTADAALVGLEALEEAALVDPDATDVIVVPGDAPLIEASLVAELVDQHRASGAAATVATHRGSGGPTVEPASEGRARRIVQPGGEPVADDALHSAGFYCFRMDLLGPAARRVGPASDDGELRLADAIEVLTDTGHPVATTTPFDADSVRSVHDRTQLAAVEQELRRRINARWLRDGVTMVDPDRTYVDSTVILGNDVVLFPGTMLRGQTVVGSGCVIGPESHLVDCAVGLGARVERTTGRDAEIGRDAVVGPFAVLEPGAQVPASTVTGPFYTAGTSES